MKKNPFFDKNLKLNELKVKLNEFSNLLTFYIQYKRLIYLSSKNLNLINNLFRKQKGFV